ncbi:MAG: polysaccharide biosynthesis tyrosine autokinase [Phycisphaerales bacterium]
MMNSIYGQNESVNLHGGVLPYAPSMLPMGTGGDSLFQIVWRGKWFILIAALFGLGGAYGYLRSIGDEYVGVSRVLVETPLAKLPDIVPAGTQGTNYLQKQVGIITTTTEIRQRALSDPNVRVLRIVSDPNRLQDVLDTLSVKVGKDDIINVTLSSQEPEEAAVIVNALVNAYIWWHNKNKRDSVTDLYDSLDRQMRSVKAELLRERERLVALAKTASVSATQGSIDTSLLDDYRKQLAAASSYMIQQQFYCTRLEKLKSDPNAFRLYVLQQGVVGESSERSRLVEIRNSARLQLDGLLAGGPVQKSQITLLENREKEYAQKIVEFDKTFVDEQLAAATSLLEDGKQREELFTQRCKDELARLQSISGEDAEYELAKLRCQMLEDWYHTLMGKIQSLDFNERQETLSIRVLGRAVAGVQAPTQMARVMGIGLVLGLMVGGGLAFLRDWRDQRVRSADEITAILGVPILGAVPTIPRRGIIRRGPRGRLAMHTREFEAYRSIRTALFFGTACDDAKTLLVTSPGPLEGKTTLVSNLGVAMARAGQKTLIIDADLRKPMQHRVFSKKGHGKGLVDVLAGTAVLEEAVRPTDVEGLDVLESGPIVPNPSELLGSDAFWTVFERLKGRYDRILVDSPPVGIVADAQILAARCGLTLLVLRAQRSSRLTTQRARDALSTVSARVVGAVVNDVPRGDTRYSHYGSGAYSYYHSGREPDGRKTDRKELLADTGAREGDEQTPPEKQE